MTFRRSSEPSESKHAVRPVGAWRPIASLFIPGTVLILVIAVAGSLLARNLYDDAIRNTHHSLTSLATVLADQADRAMQAIELVEDAVSDDLVDGMVETEADFVARASQYAIHDRLRTRIGAMPQVDAVLLVDDQGHPLNTSRSWPNPDIDVVDRDYLRTLSQDRHPQHFITKPVKTHGNGTWTIYIGRSVTTPAGQFLGLVLGAVDLHYFEALYGEIAPEADDTIFMVATDGLLAARYPARPDATGRAFSNGAAAQILASSPSGNGVLRVRKGVDGLDRLISTRALTHFPFVVGVSRTTSSALANWRKEAIALAVAMALLVVGLCFTLTLGARQIRGQRRLARSEGARVAAEERERGERVLREEYARFGTALDSMTQGLCLFDAADRLVVINARFVAMYGVPQPLQRPGTPRDALLDHIGLAIVGGDVGRLSLGEARSHADAPAPIDATRELVDGRVVSVCHAPVPGGGFVCTHEDVTERRRTEAMITHMAHHDALTQLPNRLLLHEHMERLIGSEAQCRGGAVLLLDLDGFKQVNDVHGHLFGDDLLRLVARRLRGHVGEGDLLARLGGDEFAIVRHGGAQPGDGQDLAARIVAALGEPFTVQGTEVTIGTSIGLALPDAADCTPEMLLRNADIALYRAKASGRGTCCFFEPRMDLENRERQALEADLRRAVAERQFELHYQPIFETRGRGLTACEALVRWRHPVRGLVSPGAFIPLCEEIGLIRDLGTWVLERACADAVGWPEAVKVAVNLSPLQFRSGDLADEVRRALATSGLAPQRLELEITESVLLQEDSTNLAILRALHGLGVQISMDDFGTGYSSLSYLRRFPFDKIKIDQSFVRDLTADGESVAIVRAAIGLGRALGMTVLAEGVETADQAAILEAEGCHELQGYHLGRPKPLGEIAGVIGMSASAARPAGAGTPPVKAAA